MDWSTKNKIKLPEFVENAQYRVHVKEEKDKVFISGVALKNKIMKALLDKEYKMRIRRQYEKKYVLEIMRKKYQKTYMKCLANTI